MHTTKLPLKKLHDKYGIDWQKKEYITINTFQGKFTLKELIKKYNLNTDDLNFVFIKYIYESFSGRNYEDIGGIELSSLNGLEKYNLLDDGFYTKKKFEDYRKLDNITVYVISVKKEAIKEVKKYEWSVYNLVHFTDYNERFNYKESKDKLYLNSHLWRAWNNRRDIADCLDKSGYSVFNKRNQLERKLQEIKQNKLNKVISTQFNKANSDLFNKIMQAKKELAQELVSTSTYEETSKVIRKLDIIEKSLERYERHINNLNNSLNPEIREWNKYTSIGEVNNNIAKIDNWIDNLETV